MWRHERALDVPPGERAGGRENYATIAAGVVGAPHSVVCRATLASPKGAFSGTLRTSCRRPTENRCCRPCRACSGRRKRRPSTSSSSSDRRRRTGTSCRAMSGPACSRPYRGRSWAARRECRKRRFRFRSASCLWWLDSSASRRPLSSRVGRASIPRARARRTRPAATATRSPSVLVDPWLGMLARAEDAFKEMARLSAHRQLRWRLRDANAPRFRGVRRARRRAERRAERPRTCLSRARSPNASPTRKRSR